MNPSYSQCAFKLYLPEYVEYDDNINIKYRFEYKKENTEKIVYSQAVITDRFGVSYNESNTRFFSTSKKLAQSASISFWHNEKKIWMKKAKLELTFFSEKGQKTKVIFSFEDGTKGKLLDVYNEKMTVEDETVFFNTVSEYAKMEQSTTSGVKQELAISNNDLQNDSMSYNDDIPEMEQYLKALNTEKRFLMNEGGRKYKVTNGKLISDSKGIFSYIFDLETELHISDDAPIVVSTGVCQTTGSVLMCEDFQMILQLDANIGDRVGSALIRVEPWKLLDSLQGRLCAGTGIHGSKIATLLIKEGPGLATNKSDEYIPKGQDAVIAKAMSEPVCVVWGPPGTGKTHTMSEIAIRFINMGKNVLIVSHSNVSVDGVAKKIDELLIEKGQADILKSGKILRYGYIRDEELNKNPYVNSFNYAIKKNTLLNDKIERLQTEYDEIKHTKGLGNKRIIEIRKEIGKIRSQIREQEQRYVSEASVVATTISKVVIDKLFDSKKYDVVMFDEVSMAYVLQIVCAAKFAKEHFICVGDFMQLAPIAQSSKKDILCQDIFSYLGINRHGITYYHPWLVMLNEQRRMHAKIAEFSNQNVYNNLLTNHPDTKTSRDEIVNAEPFNEQSINLIDLSGSYCAASKNGDNSRFNILSALISFAIAVKAEKNVESVSIITPYAAQTRLVRAMELDYRQHNNTEIRCATVHQFQGSESDVVLFDAVESFPSKKPGWLMGKDFNSILRLVNVAVTRAKGKLITVANSTFWNKHYKGTSHTFYRLISYLADKGNTVHHTEDKSLEKLISDLSLDGGPVFYLEPKEYMELFLKDISNSRGKIVISFPDGGIDSEYEDIICSHLEEKKKQGIEVLIKCNDYANLPERWKKYTWGTDNAIFPVIIIDEKITWYGVPQATWKFVDGDYGYNTVCPIACRIKGEHTAEMIRSLSDIEYRETAGGRTQLLPRPEAAGDNPTGPSGLASYVSKYKKCPECKQSLNMTKGKSGKTILWCKECKKTHLLSPDDINHYMLINHVKCPLHKCDMEAKVGKWGLYIRCDAGHNIKPEEI